MAFYDGGPQLRAHQVRTLDDRVAILKRMVWLGDQAFGRRNNPIGGLKDPRMRAIGLEVVSACRARDDVCELNAIYEFVKRNVRYTGDITDKDTFQTAWRTLQMAGGDCLPHDTLLMVSQFGANGLMYTAPRLVPIRDVHVGDHVMEGGRWVPITQHWFTGRKQILVFELSNGAALRCSPEHRLFRLDGTEVRAARAEVGEHLLTPREPIQFGGVEDLIPVSPDGVRVTAVRAEKHAALCFDIATETGRFWLPESDAIVHNCDDHSVLNAVLAMENGFQTRFRITSNTGATWDHIYALAGQPKNNPRRWVPLDTTLPGASKFGVHPPMAKYKDFDVTEP